MAAPNFKAIIMVQTVGAATPTFFTTSTAWLEAPSYVRIFLRSFACQKQTTQKQGATFLEWNLELGLTNQLNDLIQFE
jgi:hypothetical protein